MIRKPISTPTRLMLGAAAFALLVALYAWISYDVHVENPRNRTVPTLSQFVEGWRTMLDTEGNVHLGEDLAASVWRLSLGVLTGVALAFVAGLLMGCFPVADAFLGPPIAAFARIPPTAMLAVYFVFLSIGGVQIYAALISLGIFPTLAMAIAGAARTDVDDHTVDKAYTLGGSSVEVIWNVVLRQILPRILEAVRLQIGPAMVFLIAAEWALADVGFGYTLRIQSRLQNMNIVYTYLAVLAVLGLLLDFGLVGLRRWLAPWFRA